MIIIIGLGNPGEQYKNTRHNVGFQAVNKIAENFQFPIFNFQSKSNAEISQGEIAGKKIILAKPQTFMNESGKAVQEIIKNKPEGDLIIVHDDVDLPVGKIKIVKERGSAGHKGVESIIKSIGNDGLVRFRIGVGAEKNSQAMDIVLKNFSESEQKIIDLAVQKTVLALELFIKEGLEKTMNEYNG